MSAKLQNCFPALGREHAEHLVVYQMGSRSSFSPWPTRRAESTPNAQLASQTCLRP